LVTLSQSATTFGEAAGHDTLTATINKVYFNDIVVTIGTSGTATPTTDFTLPTTITITAGNLTGTATLTAVQDQVVESDETVVVDILSVTNGVEDGIQQVTSTILDDDTSVLSAAATTQASGSMYR
jgi:NAD-dependent SIR2 family protein deacetylase